MTRALYNFQTRKWIAPTLIALALALLPQLAAAELCADAFERLYPEGGESVVRHVKGTEIETTYGLEAEFRIGKAPGVLEWYRPSNKTEEQWFAMSLEERQAAIGESTGGGFVKTSRGPEWLQDALSSDPGGAELISRPTNSLEEAFRWINEVEATAGGNGRDRSKAFYWQGNMAYNHGSSFSADNAEGIQGYVKLSGDLAVLGKLHRGYESHLQNSAIIPGKFMGHSVLGPINTKKLSEMQQEIDAASRNESLRNTSHYIQGFYFRTWPYPVGGEARDPHKDVVVLKRELRRFTHALEQGFGKYESFKRISVTDESAHFALYSQPVQRLLDGIDSYYKGRYALPLRPMEKEYPAALGLRGRAATALKDKITTARAEYLATLESLAAEYGSSSYSPEMKNKVRVALGKFAYDSGIYPAIDKYLAEKVALAE